MVQLAGSVAKLSVYQHGEVGGGGMKGEWGRGGEQWMKAHFG